MTSKTTSRTRKSNSRKFSKTRKGGSAVKSRSRSPDPAPRNAESRPAGIVLHEGDLYKHKDEKIIKKYLNTLSDADLRVFSKLSDLNRRYRSPSAGLDPKRGSGSKELLYQLAHTILIKRIQDNRRDT